LKFKTNRIKQTINIYIKQKMYSNKDNNKSVVAHSAVGGNSPLAPRLLGSGASGVFELLFFHPVDTTAKRLMSNVEPIFVRGNMTATMNNANAVIFRDAANLGFVAKWKSMFPGVGFAFGYKVLQRTYKFGGQPYVKDAMNKNFGAGLQERFGKNTGKSLTSAFAGSLMGVGEVAFCLWTCSRLRLKLTPTHSRDEVLWKSS